VRHRTDLLVRGQDGPGVDTPLKVIDLPSEEQITTFAGALLDQVGLAMCIARESVAGCEWRKGEIFALLKSQHFDRALA
jgi:hypothetical protein